MKKEDLPQDKSSALDNFTREVCYVKNEEGKYEKELSIGWQVKSDALDGAWQEINRRITDAAQQVIEGEKSPVLFFMELNLMDFPTLAGYTGFWQFTIKRHLKPKVFNRLSDRKLGRYAKAFKITIDELKNFDGKNIDGYIKK